MIKINNENKDVDIENYKKGLKKFPISNKSTVGKVLKGDKDVPIYKERFHVKMTENNGQPSDLYVKIKYLINILQLTMIYLKEILKIIMKIFITKKIMLKKEKDIIKKKII